MKEDLNEQKSINVLLEKLLRFEYNPLKPEDLTDILKCVKPIVEYRNRKLSDEKQKFEEHIKQLKDDGYVSNWHYNGCYVVKFSSPIPTVDIVKADDKKTVAHLADCLEEKMKERIEKLEKENAELKEESDFYNKERGNYKAMYLKEILKKKKTKDQLIKAKEIIRTFLNMPMPNNEEVFADVGIFLTKAEQFLKEIEK